MLSSFLLRKLLSLSAVIKISLRQAGERISSIFESEKIQVVSALSWLKVFVSAAWSCKRVTWSYSSCFSCLILWMSSTRVWQLDYCISFLETLLIQLVRNTQEDKTIHVFYSPGTSRKLEGYHCLVVIVEIIQRDLGENCLLCTHEVCSGVCTGILCKDQFPKHSKCICATQ